MTVDETGEDHPTNSALAQACYKRLDNNSVVFNFVPSTYL